MASAAPRGHITTGIFSTDKVVLNFLSKQFRTVWHYGMPHFPHKKVRNHIYWIVGRSTNVVFIGTTAIYGVVLTSDKLAAKVSFARFNRK